MRKIATLLLIALFSVTVLAETTQDSKLVWQFSDDVIELFAPPTDATIEEMRTWADRLERPIPDDTEKWGGFKKYWERVALLKIDISKQIIASKPDDVLLSLAWHMQWFPHLTLAIHDKANIPRFENFYAELKKQNEERGRKLDRFTNNLMRTRGAVVRDLLEIDNNEKYLAWGKELLAEYDALLEGKPLGKNAEEFYGSKYELLLDMEDHAAAQTFREEMHELVNTRESELETASLYYYFGPLASFRTPEGQILQRAWMEQITNRITAVEDPDNRFGLYQVKGDILYNLRQNNAATEEEYLAYAQELEAQFDKDGNVGYLNDIYNAYFLLFLRQFEHLVESAQITDEALQHLFASAQHMLHAGESAYGHGGKAFVAFTNGGKGDILFARLTPEQQTFYIAALTELLDETEKVETEWIAAGKPMGNPSELPPLQAHLSRLQLLGSEVTLGGTTLDGKPFDLVNLRGKVVLIDFWATWCLPCRAAIPGMKELYEQYHPAGFEIVGISIDSEQDREKLVEFVMSQRLTWIHIHDPKKELFKQLYGNTIPHCFLLDPEGKVILPDARGETLKQKLAAIFAR